MSWLAALGIIATVILDSSEQLFFTFGAKNKKMKWIYWGLGAAAYVISVAIWYPLLTILPIGVALPLVSLTYVATPLSARFFLKEGISLWRWSAIALVFSGVVIISIWGSWE